MDHHYRALIIVFNILGFLVCQITLKKRSKFTPLRLGYFGVMLDRWTTFIQALSNYYSNSGVIIDHTIFQFLVELLVTSQN